MSTLDPAQIAAEFGIASGVAVWALCRCARSATITTLGVWVTTAGTAPGTGVNNLGIYSEAGVRLALTADMATEFAVAGWKEGVLAASVNLVAGTNYYLHMLTHMTGDPKIGYGPNLGFSARSPINGHYSTLYIAAQATSPASFNPATATQSGAVWYAGAR